VAPHTCGTGPARAGCGWAGARAGQGARRRTEQRVAPSGPLAGLRRVSRSPNRVDAVPTYRARVALACVLACALAAENAVLSGSAGRAAALPTVSVSGPQAAPGSQIQVRLENWPDGPVNVAVCGNLARRGTQDCDPRTSEGVAARGGAALLLVTVPV